MFYSYFAVFFFFLISVLTGNSSKLIKLNPIYCNPVHTGTGVTCKYEFFKYFNGGHRSFYIGDSSNITIKEPLKPKNCTTVHTGVTCRYEFFKYFNVDNDHKTIYIVQKTSKIHRPNKMRCSHKGFLDLLENNYNKFSIYTKRYNYNIKQREVNGFWISGKELGNYRI